MQTTIQNASAIRVGSVKLEVGTSLASMVNIGAIRGATFKNKGTTDKILFDNAPEITKYSNGDLYSFATNLVEINWDNIKLMNDGSMTIVNTPGTLVNVTNEAYGTGWTVGTPIRILSKNGNNTAVGSVVVKAGAPTLVLNTDYRLYVADGTNGINGFTYIVPLTPQTLAITVSYSYTPNATKTITFSSTGTKIGRFVRITNTDANGKTQVITMSGTTNILPIEVSFASDNEANVSEMPIELEGTIVSITDEQAA